MRRHGVEPAAAGSGSRGPNPDSVSDLASGFGTVGVVNESRAGTDADTDALAARLLAVHRALAALGADSDARIRLHLRFMAICTSLKMPGANRVRGAQRLDRLMADADQARRGNAGRSG